MKQCLVLPYLKFLLRATWRYDELWQVKAKRSHKELLFKNRRKRMRTHEESLGMNAPPFHSKTSFHFPFSDARE